MSKTKHKRDKARRRSKLVKKGAYSGDSIRIGNFWKKEKERKGILDKEKLLALRKLIEEEK